MTQNPHTAKSTRLFWVCSMSAYLLMAWLLSGMTRDGLWVFIVATFLLGVAIAAFLRGRRRVLFSLHLIAALLSTCVLSLEFVLHTMPDVLNGAMANAAYSGYHERAGGIYRLDRHLAFAIKPSLEKDIYWNGHWWRHQANAGGYRGTLLTAADVVFVGDSMIYGHGVETSETVPARFEQLTGLRSANLGQQGTGAIQYMLLLRRHGIALKPRYVFVCWHNTDLQDVTRYYGEDSLSRFVDSPLDDPVAPLARGKFQPHRWDLVQRWSSGVAPALRFAGVWRKARRVLRKQGLKILFAGPLGEVGDDRPYQPDEAILTQPFAPQESVSEEIRLQWQAHTRALLQLKADAERIGARLVLFDLGYPHAMSRTAEKFARDHQILYSNAGRVVLDRALQGEGVYLARDGHWTSDGCSHIAAELAKMIGQIEDRR